MFASKHLDKEISYECEVFSHETMLQRHCNPLILRWYDAHAAVPAAFNTQHLDC